ncbi:MAG: hypothetical protein U1F14_11635 [Steroidobacteraceae bacterium]
MDLYRILAWAHLVLAILTMGMALFWLIMLVALRQKFPRDEADRWLGTANRARWPHVIVPWSLRLPLPVISWALLAALAVTGVLIARVHGAPSGTAWTVKQALVVALIVIQVPMSRRPSAAFIHAGFWVTLATIVVSGLSTRMVP